MSALASSLSGGTTAPSWVLDPRVLVFELLTTFMVREPQLTLVEGFLRKTRDGRSSVVQV